MIIKTIQNQQTRKETPPKKTHPSNKHKPTTKSKLTKDKNKQTKQTKKHHQHQQTNKNKHCSLLTGLISDRPRISGSLYNSGPPRATFTRISTQLHVHVQFYLTLSPLIYLYPDTRFKYANLDMHFYYMNSVFGVKNVHVHIISIGYFIAYIL